MLHAIHMTGEAWFFPHGYLNGWANSLIEDAERVPAGASNYYRVSALVAVMSFEAYLNYVGERHIEKWPERKPWAEKLKLILKKFGLESLQSNEPFSSLKELFEYRNTLAHGRIAVNPLDYLDHGDGRVEGNHTGDPEWYVQFGNREQAKKSLQTIRECMIAIHLKADPQDVRLPWAIFGSGQSSEA